MRYAAEHDDTREVALCLKQTVEPLQSFKGSRDALKAASTTFAMAMS